MGAGNRTPIRRSGVYYDTDALATPFRSRPVHRSIAPIQCNRRASLPPVSDADAIYAVVLTELWRGRDHDVMWLQQETHSGSVCDAPGLRPWGREWEEVQRNFTVVNLQSHVLRSALQLDVPYQWVVFAEIFASDARLMFQAGNERPHPVEYAVVSAVGFNERRTRALVNVVLHNRHIRSAMGAIRTMELRDSEWRDAEMGCGWGSGVGAGPAVF
jgi:hypothetical protein